MIFQSWDTANKPTELSDYSVCTTWGVKDKHLYLFMSSQASWLSGSEARGEGASEAFRVQNYLDRGQGIGHATDSRIRDEGMHAIKKYEPTMDKIMRMNSVTSTIENGFVHLPEKAAWLRRIYTRNDSISQWEIRRSGRFDISSPGLAEEQLHELVSGLIEYEKQEVARIKATQQAAIIPESRPCTGCNGVMSQRIPGGLRCANCGAQWPPPGTQPRIQYPTRRDILNGVNCPRPHLAGKWNR